MPFPKSPVGENDHLLDIFETEVEVEYTRHHLTS